MTMEVLALVMHFLITLCILGGYLFTVAKGQPDETLKNLLMVIGGYWFGAIGKSMWMSNKNQAQPPASDTKTKAGDGQ